MSDAFRPEEFFPRDLFERITDTRVTRPEVVMEEAKGRRRRPRLTRDGRLTILAADHPARMVVGVGDDPVAMGSRWKLLARILRVITAEEFDGLMTTPDILEELLIVNRLDKELGGPGFLDHKVLIGCMNRGGLAGAAFELDDRMTAFTPERIGEDFYPYRPTHLRHRPTLRSLARLTNTVQTALDSGRYVGAIWLEGSPAVEETLYWLDLLIDARVPIAGNASQRAHGGLGNDGDRNIVHAVEYITSRIWAGSDGADVVGIAGQDLAEPFTGVQELVLEQGAVSPPDMGLLVQRVLPEDALEARSRGIDP